PAPLSLMMVGDRGPEVVALQQRLNVFGAQLTIDGVFGTGTRAAVIAFQASRGLATDGVVGRTLARRSGCKVRRCTPAVVTVLVCVWSAAVNAATSTYTSIRSRDCTSPADLTTRSQDLGIQECPALRDWRLLLVSSQENTWIELQSPMFSWSSE